MVLQRLSLKVLHRKIIPENLDCVVVTNRLRNRASLAPVKRLLVLATHTVLPIKVIAVTIQ